MPKNGRWFGQIYYLVLWTQESVLARKLIIRELAQKISIKINFW